MGQSADFPWLVKCASAALLSLLACAIVTARLGGGLELPATTTRDGALLILDRYVREPIPDVVLVGSSLTFRLSEEYFETPRLRNLALAGGSPLTGLAIVARQSQLPKIILVETNVLSRPADDVLVEKYAREQHVEPLLLRPLRSAVASYENWMHKPASHSQVADALNRLIMQAPSDFDNRVYVERSVSGLDALDPSPVVRMSVEIMRGLIPELERRGAKVFLFELPYLDQVENTRSAMITREVVHAAFPEPSRWLPIDVARSELRWADGVHLDERSALITARSMEKNLTMQGRGG
jgi:hypothetical protein